MDTYELKEILQRELSQGQTVDNLIEYVFGSKDIENTIITKHYGHSIRINHNRKKKLIKEYIESLV